MRPPAEDRYTDPLLRAVHAHRPRHSLKPPGPPGGPSRSLLSPAAPLSLRLPAGAQALQHSTRTNATSGRPRPVDGVSRHPPAPGRGRPRPTRAPADNGHNSTGTHNSDGTENRAFKRKTGLDASYDHQAATADTHRPAQGAAWAGQLATLPRPHPLDLEASSAESFTQKTTE